MEAQMNQSPVGVESSRSRRRSEAQELFNCECGKTYLTFSALYLHAKLKHNKRLTNKKNENNHKTEEINNKKYTTYFLRENTHHNQNQPQTHEQPQQTPSPVSSSSLPSTTTYQQKIQLFLTHINTQRNALQPSISTYQLVLETFIDYFREIETLNTEAVDDNQQPLDITYYFNEFCTYYVPVARRSHRIGSIKPELVIKVVFELWRWLKTNSMTTIDLACDQNYPGTSQR